MTPVEETKTSVGSHPSSRAVVVAVVSTSSFPGPPVKTFELPELTTTPRTLPPKRQSRHQRTGGPAVIDRVNTPATALPGASSASIRSFRPV